MSARRLPRTRAEATAASSRWSATPACTTGEVRDALAAALAPATVVAAEDALLPAGDLSRDLAPYLGDDPVFGRMSPLGLEWFFAPERVAALRARTDSRRARDRTRHRQRVRQSSLPTPTSSSTRTSRAGRSSSASAGTRSANLGADNAGGAGRRALQARLLRRLAGRGPAGRAAARPRRLVPRHERQPDAPRLVAGALFRRALAITARRPFRVVPFFDPGPWGGQWMRQPLRTPGRRAELRLVLRLRAGGEQPAASASAAHDRDRRRSTWSFTGTRCELLGEPRPRAFGAEFPIRFDFLDTMGGGNLSLQVHPLTRRTSASASA